jgi:uncharacterized membrane protein YraQ (UPF0718 family)
LSEVTSLFENAFVLVAEHVPGQGLEEEGLRGLINQIESTFGIVGVPLLIAYVATLVVWQGRKRSKRFRERTDALYARWHLSPSPQTKRRAAWVLAVLAILAYAWCVYCGKSITEKAAHDASFFHILTTFSLSTFPYFVAGCVLSGVVSRDVMDDSRWLPKSMLGAGLFASLLPVCSCAAVAFAYSLMITQKVRLRAVITFMIVVPILNPFVIVFSYGTLGLEYTFWRIVATFGLAMLTGTLIEEFLGKGCSGGAVKLEKTDSSMETAFDLMRQLAPYIIIGMLIGTAFALYLPAYVVGDYLSGPFGLLLAAGIGVPIFLCSGEDVLILAPLMQSGLPMGHAIALTIAGNGICLSSIALLVPLFGKKAAVWIVIAFFVGSLIIGLFINMLNALQPTVG